METEARPRVHTGVEKVIAKFGALADEVKGLVGAGLEGGCSRDT